MTRDERMLRQHEQLFPERRITNRSERFYTRVMRVCLWTAILSFTAAMVLLAITVRAAASLGK